MAAADDDGAIFLDDLLEDRNSDVGSDDKSAAPKEDDLSDAASISSTDTIDESQQRHNYWDPDVEITDEGASEDPNTGSENGGAEPTPSVHVASNNAATQNGTNSSPEATPTIPTGRSIAHFDIFDKPAHVISLDIEKASDKIGACSLSAECTYVNINATGKSIKKDTAANITRNDDTFHEFINPGEDSFDFWSEACMAVHNLNPNSPCILAAKGRTEVWRNFEAWVDRVVPDGEVAIMVAWNGETCDLKWFWEMTQAPYSPYHMPPKLKYFIDPYDMIKKYTSIPVHPKHSKIESLELGSVWKYLFGRNLNGAHNSLNDAKAQTDIMIHKDVIPFINRTNTIKLITDIFSKKQQDDWKKKMEPNLPLHDPWRDQKKDNDVKWTPSRRDQYTGPEGGPTMGPTSYIRGVATSAQTLACMFLAIMPLAFWERVAVMSHKYFYEDWVVETSAKDRDGNVKKSKYLKQCTSSTEGARHRGDKERIRYKWTAGYALAFVAILIIQGAHFGSHKRTARKMWRNAPHGLGIPYIRNSMRLDAYEFARRSIHFVDNAHQVEKGQPGYDALYKVTSAMNTMMEGIQKCWKPGKHVTIH